MRVRLGLAAALAGVCMPSLGLAQALADREAALKRPLSPGAVAMLVEHGTAPEVQKRLSQAISHASPDIRAAAARVVFVSGLRGLLPEIETALSRENLEDPALEQVRALTSLGGGTYDKAVLEALGRLGPAAPRAAAAFAFVRGVAALAAVGVVRSSDKSASGLIPFLAATRMDASTLTRLANTAVQDGDAILFEALVRTATQLGLEWPDDLLSIGLVRFTDAEARRAGIEYLLRSWDGERPLSEALRATLVNASSAQVDETDREAVVFNELMARAGGRQPVATSAWLDALNARDGQYWPLLRRPTAARLLTADEQARVGLDPTRKPVVTPPRSQGQPAQPLMHTVDRYPNRFLSDLMAVAGCTPRRARDQVAAAVVTLRSDGRAQRVSLLLSETTDKWCGIAARVALVAHVTDWSRPGADQRLLVLPMGSEFVECRESMLTDVKLPRAVGLRLKQPKKTRDVRPAYPESAIDERIQGTVIVESTIAATGCVREARVAASADPRLGMSAIRAIIGWRFTPSVVDDTPIAVQMTVTTNFALQ